MTTMDKLPSDVADALRDIVSDDIPETEIQTLVLVEYLLGRQDEETNGRILRWAWDRYIDQPARDRLKPCVAGPSD